MFLLVFLVLISPFSSAQLISKIGSGSVTLRPEVVEGEATIIERTLEIINENDFPVDIELVPSEGIESIIEVIDGQFTLEANTEKYARYNLILEDSYTYSGDLNVFFTKDGAGAGFVLPYSIHIIGDKGEDPNVNIDNEVDREESDFSISFGGSKNDDSEVTGNVVSKELDSGSFPFGFLAMGWIFILAIVGFVFLLRR